MSCGLHSALRFLLSVTGGCGASSSRMLPVAGYWLGVTKCGRHNSAIIAWHLPVNCSVSNGVPVLVRGAGDVSIFPGAVAVMARGSCRTPYCWAGPAPRMRVRVRFKADGFWGCCWSVVWGLHRFGLGGSAWCCRGLARGRCLISWCAGRAGPGVRFPRRQPRRAHYRREAEPLLPDLLPDLRPVFRHRATPARRRTTPPGAGRRAPDVVEAQELEPAAGAFCVGRDGCSARPCGRSRQRVGCSGDGVRPRPTFGDPPQPGRPRGRREVRLSAGAPLSIVCPSYRIGGGSVDGRAR